MAPLLWLATALCAHAGEHDLVATADYDRIGVGVARTAGVAGGDPVGGSLEAALPSLEIQWRSVRWSRVFRRVGTVQRIHFARDPSGRIVLEELALASQFAALYARPAQGELLTLSLIGGTWDQVWWSGASPDLQLQFFSPIRLTLFGLSDTDQDDDVRLKATAGAGAGAGTEALLRIYRGIGLHGRAEGGAETRWRHDGAGPDPFRHDVWASGEASLMWLQGDVAWTFGFWTEYRTQWVTEAHGCGIDRRVVAGGFRLGTRVFHEPPAVRPPEEPAVEPVPEGDPAD